MKPPPPPSPDKLPPDGRYFGFWSKKKENPYLLGFVEDEGEHECGTIQRLSEAWRSLDKREKDFYKEEVYNPKRTTSSTGPK